MEVCDAPLEVLRGVYVVRDSRVLVVAEVVAAHLLGVVQELPGEQRLHLKHKDVRQVSGKALNCHLFPLQIVSVSSKQYRNIKTNI